MRRFQEPHPELGRPPSFKRTSRAQRSLTVAALVVVALFALAWTAKGSLGDAADVDTQLRQPPRQQPTQRQAFSFEYEGIAYWVRPVAEYELWGLVVSHNNPAGFGDIYHDETSVDTRDLCVIWGDNLATDDFRQVDFSSGSFTCYWQHGPGVTFDPAGIGNNHLITDRADLRERIDGVREGDQIRLRGLLVDYQDERHPDFWRQSSTVRDDDGPGACEVIFVEQLDVLKRATPVWYALFALGGWLVGAVLLAKVGLLLYELRHRPRGRRALPALRT